MPKNKRGEWSHDESLRLQAELPDPNPSGLCLCGCGQETSIASVTMRVRGWVRGKHVRYCHGHSARVGTGPLEEALLREASSVKRRQIRFRWAEGSYTDANIQEVYKIQQGHCAYCRTELEGRYHIDHRRPLSRGGSNHPSNLALACGTCNRRKWRRTDEEFLDYLIHGPRPENRPDDQDYVWDEALRRRLTLQKDPIWSRAHPELDGCKECGRSNLRHWADGLCRPCWNKRRNEQRQAARGTPWMKKAPFHACCQRCGGTERKHYGKGYCQPCYMHLFHKGAIPLTGKRSIPTHPTTGKRSKA